MSWVLWSFHENLSEVLSCIVKGDETMALYHEPLSKRDSMQRHRKSELTHKKASQQSGKTTISTIFWVVTHILLTDVEGRNTTVIAVYYTDLAIVKQCWVEEYSFGMAMHLYTQLLFANTDFLNSIIHPDLVSSGYH